MLGHLFVDTGDFGPPCLIQRDDCVVVQNLCRTRQNHFGCPFDVGDQCAVLFIDDAHAFAFGVEGEFADDSGVGIFAHPRLVGGDDQRRFGRFTDDLPVLLLLSQHGMVAEQPCLQKELQRSVAFVVVALTLLFEVSGRVVPCAGEMEALMGEPDLFDGHLVFGDGARFVGTDHCSGAECFGSLQVTQQRFLPYHRLDPQRQCDCHNRREPFGYDGHGE